MKLIHLSAKKPLEVGTFGETPTKSNKGNLVFRTEEDAAGIYVEKIEFAPIHLELPYQVQVHANIGSFATLKSAPSNIDLKCLNTLLTYIQDVLKHSFSIEWFTAWAGEENQAISKKRELTLSELNSPFQCWLEGNISKSDISFFAKFFIGLGNEATVKKPLELVDCMKRVLSEIMAKYV